MIVLEFNKDMACNECNITKNVCNITHITTRDFSHLFQKGLQILEREKKLRLIRKYFSTTQKAAVQLSLVNDVIIQHYNLMYRGLDKPTDVLSFSYFQHYTSPEMAADGLIGEILISVDTATKQAKEHHKTLKQELQFLFVHGLLHLFGYDHEEEEERKEMFDLQDEILGTKMWRELIG